MAKTAQELDDLLNAAHDKAYMTTEVLDKAHEEILDVNDIVVDALNTRDKQIEELKLNCATARNQIAELEKTFFVHQQEHCTPKDNERLQKFVANIRHTIAMQKGWCNQRVLEEKIASVLSSWESSITTAQKAKAPAVEFSFVNEEYTLRVTYNLWKWLADNEDKEKSEWPQWVMNGGVVPNCDCDCPCCEYATILAEGTGRGKNCAACPLNGIAWIAPEGYGENSCVKDPNSMYERWVNAGLGAPDRIRHAKNMILACKIAMNAQGITIPK